MSELKRSGPDAAGRSIVLLLGILSSVGSESVLVKGRTAPSDALVALREMLVLKFILTPCHIACLILNIVLGAEPTF